MPDTTQPNPEPVQPAEPSAQNYIRQVGDKIKEADNILVTLSRNPSVDEITAALGLAIYLDKIGKHVTAIYSGQTPNVLEFLKPEETFENNTNSLQDFIVALNKSKADHLRYNIDGDFVKIFITPYKTTIEESDLEFSHGDYNVDLIIALNVATPDELDAALTEHGRIMHDAFAIDITTGAPGKFGGIEWSEPTASSVSEMVADLILKLQDPNHPMDASSATALLTGIFAETERFSNGKVSPKTMSIASELMTCGADQQVVASHLNEAGDLVMNLGTAPAPESNDPTLLNIEHAPPAPEASPSEPVSEPAPAAPDEKPALAPISDPATLQPETPPEPVAEPAPTPEPTVAGPVDMPGSMDTPAGLERPVEEPEQKDYGKMIDAALAEPTLQGDGPIEPDEPLVTNMAATAAPPVMNQPEANSVPNIDYNQAPPMPDTSVPQPVPMPEAAVLPPPPPPPVDIEGAQPTPEPAPAPEPMPEPQPQPQPAPEPVSEPAPAPEPTPTPEPTPQPEQQPAVNVPTPAPGMFQIPGV